MGWKNVKQHYGIDRIVHVVDGLRICVGSGYVHDIIAIDRDLNIRRSKYHGRGEPFDGWLRAMEADKALLRRLIERPDRFQRSIPVYTWDYDGNIFEKRCEQTGWPNVTHDGHLMYENRFSMDRAEAVARAQANLAAAVDGMREAVAGRERDLADARGLLARYEAASLKLEREAVP